MNRWLGIIIAGCVAGILFGSFFDFGPAFPAYLASLAFFMFALAWVLRQTRGSLIFMCGVFFVAMSLGVARFDVESARFNPHALDASIGEHVTLEGIVADEPDERETYTRIVVEDEGGSRVLAYVNRYPAFTYGDKVLIKGVIEKPKNIDDEFDWVNYLGKDAIFYVMRYADTSVVARGEGNPVKRALFSLKRAFLGKLGETLPEPHASLAGGLILGGKQALGEEVQEQFKKTGLTHIVVLSGYNVTIIANAIIRGAAFLPRFAGFGLGIGSIVLFALMTGAGATVVRASIMAILAVLARSSGRPYVAASALVAAGFLMLLHNPKILAFDPSFQLSFLSTLGLIFFAPTAERWLGFLPARFGLREIAGATVGVQLFVLPWLLYAMGDFSLVAPVTNILVLAAVPWAMLLSFLTGAMGLISTVLAVPFAWAAWLILAYMLKIVEWFSSLPFAIFEIKTFPFLAAALIYIMYALYIAYRFKRGLPAARQGQEG